MSFIIGFTAVYTHSILSRCHWAKTWFSTIGTTVQLNLFSDTFTFSCKNHHVCDGVTPPQSALRRGSCGHWVFAHSLPNSLARMVGNADASSTAMHRARVASTKKPSSIIDCASPWGAGEQPIWSSCFSWDPGCGLNLLFFQKVESYGPAEISKIGLPPELDCLYIEMTNSFPSLSLKTCCYCCLWLLSKVARGGGRIAMTLPWSHQGRFYSQTAEYIPGTCHRSPDAETNRAHADTSEQIHLWWVARLRVSAASPHGP